MPRLQVIRVLPHALVLVAALLVCPRDAESQAFRPDFKELSCKLEAPVGQGELGLGLKYDDTKDTVFRRAEMRKRAFTYDNLSVSIEPEKSGIYFYWRPKQNYIYLYGYSNECRVIESRFDPAKPPAERHAEKTILEGCCMIYTLYQTKVTASPVAATVGELSEDINNTGYIYGWKGVKDCSKPVEREPDFIQSMLPKPKQFGLNVVPDGEALGWFMAEDLVGRKALRMAAPQGGVLKGHCKKLPHTFTLRPPPRPFPAFDDMPPYPEGNRFVPFVPEREFDWKHPRAELNVLP